MSTFDPGFLIGDGKSRLDIEGVTCVRGGRTLFEGLDLRLGEREAAIVTGPNGAGKSSLLRLAAGLLRPAAGRVTSAPAALADEHAAFDERQTLGQALGFWARLDGKFHEDGPQRMEIAHLADVPVRMLSTGQRKRATLARVITSGAVLWLLDEPLNGLDADGQRALLFAMETHLFWGGAILAASHQPLGLADARTVKLG